MRRTTSACFPGSFPRPAEVGACGRTIFCYLYSTRETQSTTTGLRARSVLSMNPGCDRRLPKMQGIYAPREVAVVPVPSEPPPASQQKRGALRALTNVATSATPDALVLDGAIASHTCEGRRILATTNADWPERRPIDSNCNEWSSSTSHQPFMPSVPGSPSGLIGQAFDGDC